MLQLVHALCLFNLTSFEVLGSDRISLIFLLGNLNLTFLVDLKLVHIALGF